MKGVNFLIFRDVFWILINLFRHFKFSKKIKNDFISRDDLAADVACVVCVCACARVPVCARAYV